MLLFLVQSFCDMYPQIDLSSRISNSRTWWRSGLESRTHVQEVAGSTPALSKSSCSDWKLIVLSKLV